MKHTQGDWEVTIIGNVIYVVSGHKEIAAVCVQPDAGHLYKPAEMEANARLIAASPNLLKALQGDEENCIPNAQTILSQALLGNYEAVKSMLRELCSIHAAAIAKTK